MVKIANLGIADLGVLEAWDRSGMIQASILAGLESHRTIGAVQTRIPEFVNCVSKISLFSFQLWRIGLGEVVSWFQRPSGPPCPAGLVLVYIADFFLNVSRTVLCGGIEPNGHGILVWRSCVTNWVTRNTYWSSTFDFWWFGDNLKSFRHSFAINNIGKTHQFSPKLVKISKNTEKSTKCCFLKSFQHFGGFLLILERTGEYSRCCLW